MKVQHFQAARARPVACSKIQQWLRVNEDAVIRYIQNLRMPAAVRTKKCVRQNSSATAPHLGQVDGHAPLRQYFSM